MRSAPSTAVYINLLKGCIREKSLSYARHVYSHLVKHRSHPVCNGLLGDYVVEVFSTCGSLDEAYRVSQRFPRRSVFCWTSIISSYTNSGRVHEALSLYREMKDEGIEPNHSTFASLFKACGSIPHYEEGKKLHKLALKRGFASDAFVGTALMNMYNKFGNISEAESVFRDMSRRDIISWTTMLTLYVDNGHGKKALQLFREMQVRCGSALLDDRVFVVSLQACGILAEDENEGKLTKEKCLHILRAMFNDSHVKECSTSIHVATTLINTYAKCGSMSEAESVFNAIIVRDLVSWNAMLTAYVEKGEGAKALDLYKQMQDENVIQDDVTLICILLSCGETENCEMCKQLHFGIVHVKCDSIPAVVSSLIYAYGNCARMIDAHICFHYFPEPDTASWNACIVGYSGEANYTGALSMFENSKLEGIIPDEITFTSVLSACTHTGHVIEGILYFESMSRDNGLDPHMQHNSILVDLFARAGDFSRIEYIVESRCQTIRMSGSFF